MSSNMDLDRRVECLEKKVNQHIIDEVSVRSVMMRWIIGLIIMVSLSFLGVGWQFMTYLENKFTDLDAKIEKVDEKIFTLYRER